MGGPKSGDALPVALNPTEPVAMSLMKSHLAYYHVFFDLAHMKKPGQINLNHPRIHIGKLERQPRFIVFFL